MKTNHSYREIPPAGRPTYYDQAMKIINVYLTKEMIAWVKSKGIMGEVIRGLILDAMEADKK